MYTSYVCGSVCVSQREDLIPMEAASRLRNTASPAATGALTAPLSKGNPLRVPVSLGGLPPDSSPVPLSLCAGIALRCAKVGTPSFPSHPAGKGKWAGWSHYQKAN